MHIKAAHKLLYFVTNAGPTDDDTVRAKDFMRTLDADVKFRNGDVPGNGKPESADFIYGNIPPEYLAAKLSKVVNDDGSVDETTGPQNAFPVASSDPASNGAGAGVSGLAAEVGSVGGGWPAPKA